MATFTAGVTTVLATPTAAGAGILYAQKVSVAQAGTLQSLSVHIAGAQTDNIKLGFYSDSANYPGALMASGQVASAAGWITTASLAGSTNVNPGNYWLVAIFQSGAGETIATDTVAGTIYTVTAQPFALPSTYPSFGTLSAPLEFSIYATLTVGLGPPPTPVTWVSNGQQTGGSGSYVAGTQSVGYILSNFANSGDTITIPAGTFSWGGTLTINKSINLSGAGVASTVLQNTGTGTMIAATSGADGHIVISGIYMKQVSTITPGSTFCLSMDRNDATNYTILVHDCTFDPGTQFGYQIACGANGFVFWNNTFLGNGGITGISLVCGKYGPGTSTGQGAWNSPSTMGNLDTTGLNNTYIEDCTFTASPTAGVNADDNSRVVVRHCLVQDTDLHAHGQETSPYGVRHYEIYSNTFRNVNAANLNLNSWVYIRGGVFVVANNVFDQPPFSKPSIILITQSINRSDNIPCQTAYPAARQVGQGWSSGSGASYGHPVIPSDGTGAILDPCYIWGNSGSGGDSYPGEVQVATYSPDDCGNGLVGSTFIQLNRDYYVGTPRPGWAPYAYPHPLRTGAGPGPGPGPSSSMKRYPKPMGHPPKLRSFVDHWPRSTDMFRNNPLSGAYIDHFPEAGDLPHNVKDEPNSYVDHFAKGGDLVKQ